MQLLNEVKQILTSLCQRSLRSMKASRYIPRCTRNTRRTFLSLRMTVEGMVVRSCESESNDTRVSVFARSPISDDEAIFEFKMFDYSPNKTSCRDCFASLAMTHK